MSFPCPSCRREMAVEPLDGGRPICPGCGRMWNVTPTFLEGIHRARSGGGSIHSICWRDTPMDGIGQVGVALLYFVLVSMLWMSLPAAGLFLFASFFAGDRMTDLSLVGAATVCVAGFFESRWLMRRFHYFSRGAVATLPTLVIAERGLFDVISLQEVLNVPWDSIVNASYSNSLLEELLLIDFATNRGARTLTVTMAGAARTRPLWDTFLYIEEQRAKPRDGRGDPGQMETAIRDAAAQRIQQS